MPTVAEQLKAARVSQGLSIHQVADVTKMRSDHVDALENGRYCVFPAPVYARGSVRTYAALLKLDPAPLIAPRAGWISLWKNDPNNWRHRAHPERSPKRRST